MNLASLRIARPRRCAARRRHRVRRRHRRTPANDKLSAGARQDRRRRTGRRAIDELKKVNDPASADWNNLMGYSLRKADAGQRRRGREVLQRGAAHRAASHRGALEYSGELYLMTGNLPMAEERLAALDKACFLPCEEYSDLKKAVARYKATGNKYVAQ